MRKEFTRLIVAVFCSFFGLTLLMIVSCGGGGGDGGSSPPPPPNYSGTWGVDVALVLNDCNANLSGRITENIVVTHSDNNVVVREGTLILTGTTNDSDGFDVSAAAIPVQSGCNSAGAIHFSGASDGNAIVGYGITVQCGSQKCSVGYGGTAVLLSPNSAISTETESDSTLDSLMNKCAQQIFEKKPDSSKESLTLDEEGLKAAATDAAKSAISKETKDTPVR